MVIEITPRVDCGSCKGFGLVPGDSVPMPFGSGYTRTPDEYCDCVVDQIPEQEIRLKLAEEVEQRIAKAVKAEDDAYAQLEQDSHDAVYDEYLQGRNYVND